MMCISIEIFTFTLKETNKVYLKLNTRVELIGDRKQYLDLNTFNKFGRQRNDLSCGFSFGRNIPKWRFTSFPDHLCLQ